MFLPRRCTSHNIANWHNSYNRNICAGARFALFRRFEGLATNMLFNSNLQTLVRRVLLFAALAVPILGQAQPVRISGLDSLNIAYSARKIEFGERRSQEARVDYPRWPAFDNYVLDIEIGPLNKAQYDILVRTFMTKSPPKFSARSKFQLVEFLPPFIQALNGLQFNPLYEDFNWPQLSDEALKNSVELNDLERFRSYKTPLTTLINCWTTAYEFLRTWKAEDENFDIDITWLSRSTATQLFMSEALTQLTPPQPPRFGDVLVFSDYNNGPDEQMIQHAAIFVLPGLYFEKTDSTEDDAFRLVLESDIQRKYKEALGSKGRAALYRLNPDTKLKRLKASLPLSAEYADLFGPYISKPDLDTITFQFDWAAGLGGNSRPEFHPYRLREIGIRSMEGRGILDASNTLREQFTQPLPLVPCEQGLISKLRSRFKLRSAR